MIRFDKPLLVMLFSLISCLHSVLLSEDTHGEDVDRQPNVILILIDDMGWGDLGCYGNEFIDTPNLDQLAEEGMRFTDFYAAGAVCSPTRCAIQSGQNQARIGITAHIPGHWRPFERIVTPLTTMALPLDTVTIAESLKKSGYRTGYVGKWHLGTGTDFQPDRQGYDSSVVINGPHLPGRYRTLNKTVSQPKPGQYRTDYEADLAIEFLDASSEEPFFLMVSPFAVHIPLGAMSSKVNKYRERAQEKGSELPNPVYAAMVEHCDDMVGRILSRVEELGMTDETLILFTSDNGGLNRRYDYQESADDVVSDLSPLRGEKGDLHEGGVRVPLIIKYPPIVSPGSVCDEPTISYDFYPTLIDLAKGKLPADQTIDGMSLVPLLVDAEAELTREALHWHYPHFHHDRPASSIRERDWKLIEYLDGSGDVELFNLRKDLSESNNVASEFRGRTNDLQNKLKKWRQSVVARMPYSNPHYDPDRAEEWWSLRTGQPIDSSVRKRFPPTELD